ncbi:MAG: hypothetical protein Tsb009_00290 [Planctomycetaceae bacterium]
MHEDIAKLLDPNAKLEDSLITAFRSVGFRDPKIAQQRLQELCPDETSREKLAICLPNLLAALSDTATPDVSLINFERYVQSVDDRLALFDNLANQPRAVEILVRLFVGSQFLTEILIRNPHFLEELTNHRSLAEFKSRPQLIAEGLHSVAHVENLEAKFNALRRFQQWELLRIGACDAFGLFDLKSVTVQLSLLADSIVQICLNQLSEELNVSTNGFCVLAFGKLGGEELNYSSDIDLVFLAETDAEQFWRLGQQLIRVIHESSAEGFLYRVDMRLRPWGRSGALVNTVDAHLNYLKEHGQAWEKQALLKARIIAGDEDVGRKFLKRVEPWMFSTSPKEVRKTIREMKSQIEEGLKKKGREWGEIKLGRGSIRDVEFVTQCLQLIHGGSCRDVRSFNTMDGLVRLADFGFLQADEFRFLSSGYMFLRTIEHSLQLMHYKQTHSLPDNRRELTYLARRLDFPNADEFLHFYERHCRAIHEVYQKYIEQEQTSASVPPDEKPSPRETHLKIPSIPSYSESFSSQEQAKHARMFEDIQRDDVFNLEATCTKEGLWTLTIVGKKRTGELPLICGMLFVRGFNILSGNVFTEKASDESSQRRFVGVFTLKPPGDELRPEIWTQYAEELSTYMQLVRSGRANDAHGQLAKRVAGAVREAAEDDSTLLPVEIEIDNEMSSEATVLQIRADDTLGFLYELTNALALTGMTVERVVVGSVGNRVFDTLFVTNQDGGKITNETRLLELRAAVVLIKHFTHLLPRSPNPEAALLQFRDFLEHLFQRQNWPAELSSLERPEVLRGLAKLLGVSTFLWEDFLRLQHANLFPVVADIEGLSHPRSKEELETELADLLKAAKDDTTRRSRLNAFKDREMFRVDMRHILSHISEFGQFAEELTDVAEVVIAAAFQICFASLEERFGHPQGQTGDPCRLSVCALGKCGGREMGFASDVELMFLYEESGKTSGPEIISNQEFVLKLVEKFNQTIKTRRKGIFEVDLRLRPYGKAGSLAVSLDAFATYFAPEGAAWPYERQALVKLRPIAGDLEFGQQIVALRDSLVYTGDPFDITAMRALREKQIRQLVKAGTFNAKLSPGGLVDCEYLVQGLQITHGSLHPQLRTRSTRKAIHALHEANIISTQQRDRLLEAYIFLRRLIDALRMVRGHARDLTVPPSDSEEFQFLARRLSYAEGVHQLQQDLEQVTHSVMELAELLDNETSSGSPA